MHIIKNLLRILGAGITAFAILCVLCFFYYNTPMCVPSTLGNTDYVWPANALYIQMTEGISAGRFDAWGFNNPWVVEEPDILVLGSSHMESTYVPQEKLLSEQLARGLEGRAAVYNMGISGCHLPQTIQYLPKTLEAFEKPPRLLLIEAHDLYLSQEQVQQILSASVPSIFAPKPRWLEPILGLPYLRLMAQQKNLGLLNLLNPPRKPVPEELASLPVDPYPEDVPEGNAYDPVFSFLQELQEAYGVQILIFYQPTEELQKDGSVFYAQDPWVRVFEGKCREYGVEFLNMTDKFYEIYESEGWLPHGFVTGRIGSGHLNAYGQQAIAEEVLDWISRKEGR